jgi:hypothetical protein
VAIKGTTSGYCQLRGGATKLGLVEDCNRTAIGLTEMAYAAHVLLNIECWKRKEWPVPQ